MKRIVSRIILLLSLNILGQQIHWTQWEEEARTDIGLLPKYGNVEKTAEEKERDSLFIIKVLQKDSTYSKGSTSLMSLGFEELQTNVKKAMYRFNQAYLLDPTNMDVYSGYGAVYMRLGEYQKAKDQYEEGLRVAPKNARILEGYGTYYMVQYYNLKKIKGETMVRNLDLAIQYLKKSYLRDQESATVPFKLSVLYKDKEDCKNAWKFYHESVANGSQQITEIYTQDLKEKCKKRRRRKK